MRVSCRDRCEAPYSRSLAGVGGRLEGVSEGDEWEDLEYRASCGVDILFCSDAYERGGKIAAARVGEDE